MARPEDQTYKTAPWRVVGKLVDILAQRTLSGSAQYACRRSGLRHPQYSRPKWLADERSRDAHGWESNVVQVELKTLGINPPGQWSRSPLTRMTPERRFERHDDDQRPRFRPRLRRYPLEAFAPTPGFAKPATLDEIAKHSHVLTPGRYVGAEEQEEDDEPFAEKYPRLVAELEEQFNESERLSALVRSTSRHYEVSWMASNWRDITLGDLVSLQRGYDLPEVNRKPGIVPVIGSGGINGFHAVARAKGPGVTIERSGVGSMGVVTYSDCDYWPQNTTLFVTDFRGNDERFVYYFLKTLGLRRLDSGSTQVSLNRNYLYPIRIRIPPIAEQRRIAITLGALDDKIEQNRRTGRALERLVTDVVTGKVDVRHHAPPIGQPSQDIEEEPAEDDVCEDDPTSAGQVELISETD